LDEPASQFQAGGERLRLLDAVAEKLEEAAAAEKVEVIGVNVIFVAEAIAGLAGACPAIVNASDSPLVVSGGGFGAVMGAEDLFVDGGEEEIERDGNEQPRGLQELFR